MSDVGRFTWYELLSTDPQGGIDFYTKLVGWGHQSWPGEMPYDLFTRGEELVAGCMQLPAEAQEMGAPTHWLGYVHADDVGAMVAQARELGATILNEMDLPDVGKIAIVQDPQSTVICFFQPVNTPGAETGPQEGRFSWHELVTSDYEAAWEFYSALFGWEMINDMDMGEYGIYRVFGRNGEQMGGMFNKLPEMPASAWLYYARVASCDEAATRIAELGGNIVNGPMDVPGGDRIVQAMDPQGGMFALHSTAQQTAEAEA